MRLLGVINDRNAFESLPWKGSEVQKAGASRTNTRKTEVEFQKQLQSYNKNSKLGLNTITVKYCTIKGEKVIVHTCIPCNPFPARQVGLQGDDNSSLAQNQVEANLHIMFI